MCAFETCEISEHSALTMTFVAIGERKNLVSCASCLLDK